MELKEELLKDFVDRLTGEKPKDAPVALTKIAADNTKDLTDTVHKYLKKNYPASTLKWVKDADWKRKKQVPLSDIKMARRPGGARETDKVKGIAQAIKDGEPMEPVVLVKLPNGDHKIADGFHRTLGFKHADKKTIDAYVGEVEKDKGTWDKEMHEKKLNVGKKASDDIEGLAKIAFVGSLAKGIGKSLKSTTDDLTGKTVRSAQKKQKQTVDQTLDNPTRSGKKDIKEANRDVTKAKWKQNTTRASGVGLAGVAGYEQLKNNQKDNQSMPQ